MSLFAYEYTCPKCGKKFEKLDEGDFVFEDITAYICKCKNCKNVFTLCSNEPQRCPKCEKFNLEDWDYMCPECNIMMKSRFLYTSFA